MWSELFDIDSLHDLVLMGKSAVLGAGIVAPLGPSEAVFRGLAAVFADNAPGWSARLACHQMRRKQRSCIST
jgi:hypothetical protein